MHISYLSQKKTSNLSLADFSQGLDSSVQPPSNQGILFSKISISWIESIAMKGLLTAPARGWLSGGRVCLLHRERGVSSDGGRFGSTWSL